MSPTASLTQTIGHTQNEWRRAGAAMIVAVAVLFNNLMGPSKNPFRLP